MLTPYSIVFKTFFTTVGDDLYFLMPEETAYEELIHLMSMAIVDFRRPRISLERDDSRMVFLNELTFHEIEMIAFLMAEKWLRKAVLDVDNLNPLHRDKDYNPTSTPGIILKTYTKILEEKKVKLVNYTRIEGSFTKLAGKR